MNEEAKNQIVRYWQEGAEEALGLAELMSEKKKFSYTLFFGHLAIEKILKALIIQKTLDHAPRVHDLLYLAGAIGLELTKGQESVLKEIAKFNIEGRYPEEKQEFYRTINQKDVDNYLPKIKELYLWLSSMLKEK